MSIPFLPPYYRAIDLSLTMPQEANLISLPDRNHRRYRLTSTKWSPSCPAQTPGDHRWWWPEEVLTMLTSRDVGNSPKHSLAGDQPVLERKTRPGPIEWLLFRLPKTDNPQRQSMQKEGLRWWFRCDLRFNFWYGSWCALQSQSREVKRNKRGEINTFCLHSDSAG